MRLIAELELLQIRNIELKKFFAAAIAAIPMILSAQTFDFDLSKPQPAYSDETGYGYDVLPAPDKKKPAEPFIFL